MRLRFKSVCLAMIVLLLAMGLPACGGGSSDSSWTGYEAVWQAGEEPDDEVYGEEADGMWRARPTASSQAYFDALIMRKELKGVKAGVYEFSAVIRINNNKYTNVRPVLLMRAVDSDGKVLVQREFYQFDWAASASDQTFKVAFQQKSSSSVKCEILWMNGSTVTIGECSLKGIPIEQFTTDDVVGYLEKGAEELTLDSSNLYYLDMYSLMLPLRNSVAGYDIGLLVSALQGIVNREENLLYIRYNEPSMLQSDQDEYWLEYLMRDGGYLADKNVVKINSVVTALHLFKDYVSGLVVWDESVPATVNAACTAAGVDNLLPVRGIGGSQTVFNFVKRNTDYEIKLDLRGRFENGKSGKIWDSSANSTGSAKNDTYLWAKEKYLDTGKTCKDVLAYHLDAYTWDKTGVSVTYYELQSVFLANKDYYIKNKCFFFDLFVFDNAVPNDDPEQEIGTDYNTLIAILEKQNELAAGELVTLGGFVPWYIKYTASAGLGTEGLPDAVAAEWQLSRLIGTYYMVKDADAYAWTSIANASIYSKVPDKGARKQPNANKLTEEAIAARIEQYIERDSNNNVVSIKPNNYVMLYMGDYDSAAWMLTNMRTNFNDANLDYMPMAWPVNFGPSKRIPFIYDYMYDLAGENSYFIGDHNGYGYLELASLADANRPQHLNGSYEDFLAVTKEYYDKYDLTIQGFLINTSANYYLDDLPYEESVMRKYSDITPDGVVCNVMPVSTGDTLNVTSENGKVVPWSRSISTANAASVEACADTLVNYFPTVSGANFCQVRTICNAPTLVRQFFARAESLGAKVTVLDPYAYFALLKEYNALQNYQI